MRYFKLTIDDRNIATLTFDTPHSQVNVFSSGALEAFEKELDQLHPNPNIKALFIESSKENIFIAGADIREIKTANDEASVRAFVKKGQDIFNKIEALPFPTIAMIDGACLGGGLEMALACTYRIATNHAHTRIGLPEVNLGILPGFGGTQRLYPLVGYAKAIELIVAGKQLKGEKALKLGLVDATVPQGYLAFKKEEFSQEILAGTLHTKVEKNRKGLLWYEKISPLRKLISTMARKKVLEKSHGHYPAPLSVIEVMQNSFGKPRTEGLTIERDAITKLALTPISKNLIDLFLIAEELKHESFSRGKAKTIKQSSIVGTGAMGSGIAWALNNQDIDVRLKVRSTNSAGKAIAKIRKIYEGIKKRRRLTEREVALKMDKITFTTEYVGFESSDFLLEAVSEEKALKQKVYADFEKVLSTDAIIASNTSSISISDLAEKLEHPERFVGMHFFNPVNRMPLVEIIAGEKSNEETIATVVKLSKKMGKTPIKVKESAGFLVNRILLPYLGEATLMFEEGESIERIDKTLLAFGMPMGPLTLVDEVGVDVGEKVSNLLHQDYGDRMPSSPVLTKMLENGYLGKKSGQGFYDYRTKKPTVNQAILALQKEQKNLDDTTLLDRAVLIMINEASRCLEECVVDNARYLDMAMVMGTGFPAFRGGLLKYADARSIENVVHRLLELQVIYGDRFQPSDLLLKMEKNCTKFYDGGVS